MPDEDQDDHFESRIAYIYRAGAQRRVAHDTLLWRVPTVSLVAQAFLLTVALGADTAPLPRVMAALLSIIAAAASLQLIWKHRKNERRESHWLEQWDKYLLDSSETKPQFSSLHSKPDYDNIPTESTKWYGLHQRAYWTTSYRVWQLLLFLFGLASVILIVVALVDPARLAAPATSARQSIQESNSLVSVQYQRGG